MAYRDWLKEYRESQGSSGTTSTTHSSTNEETTSGSAGSGDSGFSFKDALAEYRENNATVSLQGWLEASRALINDIQQTSSKWHDDATYQQRYDQVNKLLAQADGWRNQ